MTLPGLKTYLVALAMLAYAAAMYSTGSMSDGDAMRLVLEALAFAGLRSGVAKVQDAAK